MSYLFYEFTNRYDLPKTLFRPETRFYPHKNRKFQSVCWVEMFVEILLLSSRVFQVKTTLKYQKSFKWKQENSEKKLIELKQLWKCPKWRCKETKGEDAFQDRLTGSKWNLCRLQLLDKVQLSQAFFLVTWKLRGQSAKVLSKCNVDTKRVRIFKFI